VSRKHGRRGALGRRNYPQTSCAPVSSRSELNRGLAECWWTSFTSVAFLCNSIMRLRMRILGKRLHSTACLRYTSTSSHCIQTPPSFRRPKGISGLAPTDQHNSIDGCPPIIKTASDPRPPWSFSVRAGNSTQKNKLPLRYLGDKVGKILPHLGRRATEFDCSLYASKPWKNFE